MCKDEKFKNLPKRNAQFILRKRFFEKNSLFEEKQVCPFFFSKRLERFFFFFCFSYIKRIFLDKKMEEERWF